MTDRFFVEYLTSGPAASLAGTMAEADHPSCSAIGMDNRMATERLAEGEARVPVASRR
jgi:hypothetical protein